MCGPVVRALALRSGDSGFKTRSDHSLNLIPGCPWFNFPAALVNSQLVCQLGFLTVVVVNSQLVCQLGFLTVVVVVFCCFVDCVSLALKSSYGERSIKHVLYCIVLYCIKKVLEIQRTPKIRGVAQPGVIN